VLELPESIGNKTKPTKKKNKNKTKDKFDAISYEDTIAEIRDRINTVKKPQLIKSTETNWYKNASRALEHLNVVYKFTDERITKYAVYHYLDSADYRTKRTLFQVVHNLESMFQIDPEIEKHIASYFHGGVMRTKTGDREGIYIADREDAQLIVRNVDVEDDEYGFEWKDGDKFDAEDFTEESTAKYLVNKKSLNDIVGYMIQFKDQDMSFYYKDIHLKRNKKGRKCDRSGGKAPILDMLNRVVGLKMYTEDNTISVMYSGTLCVILEMLLRKFQDDKLSGKIYYLTAEQAILSKITDYSAAP
jgi:hypothetical protein